MWLNDNTAHLVSQMDVILNFCAFSVVLKASGKDYICQNTCWKWADHSCPVTSLHLKLGFAAPGMRCSTAFMYSAFQTGTSCFIHLDHICEALYSEAGLCYLYFDKMLGLNHVLQPKDPAVSIYINWRSHFYFLFGNVILCVSWCLSRFASIVLVSRTKWYSLSICLYLFRSLSLE